MQRNVPSIVHLGHIDIFVKDALLEYLPQNIYILCAQNNTHECPQHNISSASHK